MSTFNGLPAHVLLVHFIVVLAPLTAILAVLGAVWPAARRRLVWLVAALAVIVVILTPLTTEAGEWLEHRVGESPDIETHADLGDTMLYFAIALVVAAAALVFVHLRQAREKALSVVVRGAVAVLVVVIGVATIVQVVRIGESGSKAAWGDVVSNSAPQN